MVRRSDKHEVSWSNLSQNASTVQNILLAQGVPTADADTATECEVGSTISKVNFEINWSADNIASAKVIHWMIQVNPAGMTTANPNSYYQANRSYILRRGMEMLPRDLAVNIKRVFPLYIPKIYKRVKANYNLYLSYICSSTEAINACGFAIYKEKS